MRTWRVGTFSMGALLILLGLLLFSSRFFGFNIAGVMTAWWPLLLIVLGIEILAYLMAARKEQPLLKYDFLSIFFVGIIGTVGIGLAIVSSTGLIGKMEEVISRQEKSYDLPEFSQTLDEQVKRVVVRTVGYDVTIEATKEKNVAIFGAYRVQSASKEPIINNVKDYVGANKKGDTLYLTMKTLPEGTAPFGTSAMASATLLIPNNVKLEVTGNDNSIALKPRTMANDWNVERASSIIVDVDDSKDLRVAALGAENVRGAWKLSDKTKNEEGLEQKNAVYQSGMGTHKINIANTFEVTLNTGK